MVTALSIVDPKAGQIRVKVMTGPVQRGGEFFTEVTMYQCDENWIPTGLLSHAVKEESEEEIHKMIRKEAFEKEQLNKDESTNVELNPDYNEEEHKLPAGEGKTEG